LIVILFHFPFTFYPKQISFIIPQNVFMERQNIAIPRNPRYNNKTTMSKETIMLQSDPGFVTLTEEELESLFGKTLKVRGVKVVTQDEHRGRLEACGACPALTGQSVCGHCGCNVDLKAKLIASTCPHPDGPRWTPLTGHTKRDRPLSQ
jgi:hypothetical protein